MLFSTETNVERSNFRFQSIRQLIEGFDHLKKRTEKNLEEKAVET